MTMKEVLEKMRELASKSLETLKVVYDFHTNTEVTWWGRMDLDDGRLIEREIKERENVLSDEYYNLMMEIEHEVNEQFKDVNDHISYSLDYDICNNGSKAARTSLSHISIDISEDWSISVGRYAGYDHLTVLGWFPRPTSPPYYPEEDLSKGVKELVSYWRTVYDKYVAGL